MSENKKMQHYSEEAESAVLGCVFIDEKKHIVLLSMLSPNDFYRKRNVLIYEAICAVAGEGKPIDYITVREHLISKGTLEAAGGMRYLLELPETVPSALMIHQYAEIVLEKSKARTMRGALVAMLDKIDHGEPLQDAAGLFDRVRAECVKTPNTLADISIESIRAIESASDEANKSIKTGLQGIDSVLRGFYAGQLYTLAARPGQGKTALALNIALRIAKAKTCPVGFITCEMTEAELFKRAAAILTGIDHQKIRDGELNAREKESLRKVVQDLKERADILLYHEGEMDIQKVRGVALQLRYTHKIRILFIDYMAYIVPASTEKMRHEAVGEAAIGLKRLAVELEIPIVVLSQVTRDQQGKRPGLNSIRESGKVEECSDVVLFLHSEDNYSLSEGLYKDMEFIVAKNRNGPTGMRRLAFILNTTEYQDKPNDAASTAATEKYLI